MDKKLKELILDVLICTGLTAAIFFMCLYALKAEDDFAASNTATEQPEIHAVTAEPTPTTVPSPEVIQEPEEAKEPAVTPMVSIYNIPLDTKLQLFIIQLCEDYHIDSAVVMSMIETESTYRVDVMGDSGKAYGLMQVQKRYHTARMERLGCTDLLDPYQNVSVGIDFLAELIDGYGGNVEMALVAYNAGTVGATEHWFSKGIYSSAYSQKVLGKVETLTERMMRMPYTDDPVSDFDAWDADQNRLLERPPVCADCDESIQDETAYFIDGVWICENCMEAYRRDVQPEL